MAAASEAPPPPAETLEPEAQPDALIGRRVGQYVIKQRVGQGGMGLVYEARHALLDQRAAIKVLHKEMSQDEKVLQRFFNEARAISLSQHSSIVKIFDFGRLEDGIAYILMEFLDGETLLSRIDRAQRVGETLPLSTVVELGRQVAAAIAVIHDKGILHRG